jgi:hypothetical protein
MSTLEGGGLCPEGGLCPRWRRSGKAMSTSEREGYVYIGGGRLCHIRRKKAMSNVEREGYVR